MHVLLRRVLFCALIFCAPSFAQVATGTYPYGSFDNKGFDTINRGNLNTHFSIPVINKPGRGLPFYYNFSYDSSIWYPATVNGVKTWTSVPNYGWRGDTEIANGYVSYTTGGGQVVISQGPGKPPLVCRNVIISNFIYHDPFGVQHPFAGTSVQGAPAACGDFSMPSTTGFTSLATDGSGYTMKVVGLLGASIITASGQTFAPPLTPNRASGTVTDSNGNQISTDKQGHFTDTLGKQVLTVSGGSPNLETFTYTDTNGNPQSVQMSYTSYTVQTNFGCSGIVEANTPNTYLVNAVTLPDGSAYHFQYEQTPGHPASVTGRFASVTLPTGGTISYSYSGSNNGIACTDGSVAGLTRSLSSDSGSAASTWTYTRTIPTTSTSQTDIGDGNGNHTVYDFVLAGTSAYYETAHVTYQGAAGGAVLGSVETCYNGTVPDCTTSVPTLPISQIDTYMEQNNGPQRGSTFKYNKYGLATEKDDWDYGTPSARGTTVLQKELWTYPTSGIVNLVSLDEIYDGGGHVVSSTGYSYDQTTPTPSSAIPQHIAITGPRGNLTTVSQWLKTGSSITTTNLYEDTGTLLSSTGPNGTTNYAYDPTASYVTTLTPPTPSSGVSLPSSATYDSNTGLMLTATDPNGGATSVTSYDALLRPTQSYKPNGEYTFSAYSSNQIGVDESMGASGTQDVQTLFDGYGRKSRVAVGNGQASNQYYQSDSCYNAIGLLLFQSMPYQGTGWGTSKQCTGAGSTYSYDGLNRPTAISNADGTKSYTYTARATKVTDVNGVQTITQVDGLGRTSAVCEISNNASMPSSGSPQNCGLDIAGTGFLTSYAYDLANHNTTITQGLQQRIFQTDPLGRTILVQEPESGTTSYSYAYNGTGLVVTRKRARANQTNPSTLTTTTSQYDSLGRLTSVTYDDGTVNRYYAYDLATNWNTNLGQSKGHLTYAWTQPFWTGTQFSYDIMGRVTQTQECLAYHCGNYAQNVTHLYAYDLGSNLTKESYFMYLSSGTQVDTNYTFTKAREITTISNTLTGTVNDSGAILSAVVNGSNGPTSYQFGNGLDGVTTYDGLGRPNGSWVCKNSTQFECGGGTQLYGNLAQQTGARVNSIADTILNSAVYFGYDEFNRITSANYTIQQNAFTYGYDRYGNRWAQNVTQGSGPSPQFTFNTANNQIIGYSYDAAGNLLSDGMHTYTYDAEGNVLKVDGGSTATYIYDALNHRVQSVANGSNKEYAYDINGQRSTVWNGAGSTPTLLSATTYWNGRPISIYNGSTYFQHQDVHGTERLETASDSSAVGSYKNFAFGDGFSISGTDNDPYHFAQLDHDSESGTDHAQFRQYSSTSGRWMSPDPYNGSMDPSNPQSFNRYSYLMNNPLAMVDPSGLSGGCVSAFPYGSAEEPYIDPFINNSADCSSAYGTWVDDGPDETVDVGSAPVADPGTGATAVPPSSSNGGGGGGGGGGAQSNVAAPSSLVRQGQQMFSNNCNSKFGRTIPHYSNSSFFNQLANAPFQQYPAGTPNIPDHLFGADADTALGQPGRPIRLFPNFYGNDATYQAFTLIHEGIHRFTGWSDQQVFTNFAPSGLQPPGSGYGTGNITSWLQGGCKP